MATRTSKNKPASQDLNREDLHMRRLTVRLPAEIHLEIDRAQREDGVNPSAIARQALAQFFGKPELANYKERR